jgi:ABC transporter fused permease/ATP-binding protein
MARRPASSTEDLPKRKLDRAALAELRFLFTFLRPYRWLFLVSLFFLLGSSLTTLAFPFVIGQLVDQALPSNLGNLPPQARELLEQTRSGFVRLDNINGVALLLLGILVLQTLFSYFRVIWFIRIGEKTLADLRRALYQRLIVLPMTFFVNRRVGELASRLTADLTLIQETFTTTFAELLRSFINLVVGLVLIFWLSTELSLVMLAIFPLLIGAALVFGRYIRKLSKEAQDRLAESSVVIEETLQGIQNVKAFSNERYEISRYRQAIDALVAVVLRGASYRGAFISFLIFALFGSIIFMLWYGARMVNANELTMGELTSFLIYTTLIGGAFASFGDQYSQIQRAIGATERVRDLLREPTESLNPDLEVQSELRLSGLVEFEGIEFAYPSRPEIPVLQGVSFRIEPGQRIALVGPSGTGKSTLAALLLRFYDPQRGQIRLDGRSLTEYDLHSLRQRMALVPQDVFLFGGTIRDNIAYGRIGAQQSEIEAAARLANAHSFIVDFPEGYDTIVGERGVKLSGGQKQRIAIARALLRDPDLLILDEATSSLDSNSEAAVQQALDELMRGRTTLIIAHRLATVRHADLILVLDRGRIVECGTHDELMALSDGLYRLLARLQFQAESVGSG